MTTSPADLAVIGAGPAGLAAATAARRAGARVVVLDAAARPGGQYWRHRDGDNPIPARLRQDILPGHAVWHIEPGFLVHTTAGAVRARTVVIATGAYDRQLPFPGWTLPGVFTAGGAQAMLKGHGVPVGERVVVAGTGPFLLPVAAGLGTRVVGVFEAGSPLGFARHPLAIARNLGKLAEGAGYLRVPLHTRTALLAAHGDDRVRAVTVAKLDRDGQPGAAREIECDAVAVGYGFTPQVELPLQLGCDTRLDADGSLVAVADEWQRASVPGVYLAGEVCGVGGAQLSVVEGAIAGAHAAGARPKRRWLRKRAALRAFAAAMHDTYPVRGGRQADDTIVCRCEEVTAGEIRAAVTDLGATDPRGVKLLARPGMGLCQGRVCGYATACLVADAIGRPVTAADQRGMAARPVAAPVTIGNIAESVEDA